jgi:hypothetical protein
MQADTTTWKGNYFLNGAKQELRLKMNKSDNIFGINLDEAGVYILNGLVDKTNNKVNLTKSYPGKMEVFFEGTLVNFGTRYVINGK